MLKLLSHPTVHIPTSWPSPASDSDDLDLYSSYDFRMYDFKVRRCPRGRAHDWTDCPFAHPGEKSRRRDPLRHHYSGNPCLDFKKGTCARGDTCELAHGVFEVWLHPARYRTQPCKDGTACRRRVCFFAHTAEQLRAGSPAARVPVSPPVSPEALMVRMMRAMKFEEEEEEGFEGIDVGWVSELVK